MFYKVLAESVEVDGAEFLQGEVLELESDSLNVSELLASGSIEETVVEEDTPESVDEEPTLPGEDEPLPVDVV